MTPRFITYAITARSLYGQLEHYSLHLWRDEREGTWRHDFLLEGVPIYSYRERNTSAHYYTQLLSEALAYIDSYRFCIVETIDRLECPELDRTEPMTCPR